MADAQARQLIGRYAFWAALYALCVLAEFAMSTPALSPSPALRLAYTLGGAVVPLGIAALVAAVLNRRPRMARRALAVAAALAVLGLMYLGGSS